MSKSNSKPCIGVTLGDPCGIGPEIAAAALSDASLREVADYVVIGPSIFFKSFPKHSHIQCVEVSDSSAVFAPGRWGAESGRSALSSLEKAVELLKSGRVQALATAPVSKEAIHIHQKSFQGHTEFLADAFGVKDVGMMFVGEQHKTIILTRHIPLQDVPRAVTREGIISTLQLSDHALRILFGLRNPVIGVCGLNPHAGENGLMGHEEQQIIIPAIRDARGLGVNAQGPFAADTIFSGDSGHKYDLILAMYHDQGLIPVKTLSMKKLVNLTIGLPFIRTSPAHGTAFDIAGKGIADATSMKEAIKLAVELSLKTLKS